jgi:DNA invertase Pin-like site-specific DNA recombinase
MRMDIFKTALLCDCRPPPADCRRVTIQNIIVRLRMSLDVTSHFTKGFRIRLDERKLQYTNTRLSSIPKRDYSLLTTTTSANFMGGKIKAAAYVRVSTLLNLTVENQLIPLRELAGQRGFDLEVYSDEGISGTKERRPSLDRLVADARRGKFRFLIVAAIDRLGRNARHLLNLIDELNGYGVSLISLRESIDLSTPMGKAALAILSAVAQLERDLISERIKVALAARKLAAKNNGVDWRCGRPSVTDEMLKAKVLELRQAGLSIRRIEKALDKKVSRTTITRILRGFR